MIAYCILVIIIKIKPVNKFKIFKYDAAPFFFFVDIFPPEYDNKSKPHLAHLINSIKTNPIMPLPMRVDRVFNGVRSILIRPVDPISFPITEDLTAIINPTPLLQYGFEKLLYFTEVRSRENFFLSLSIERASRWWNSTRFMHGILPTLEEDFSAFLRAYLHTILKAKMLDEDIIKAAIEYCKLIGDICKKRLDENMVLTEVKGKQRNVKMYKVKELTYYKKFKKTRETQYHPELIDIEIYDLVKRGFNTDKEERANIVNELTPKEIKYIPLLLYDDLLECMLQNTKRLEENNREIIGPSILLNKKVIVTEKSKDFEKKNLETYTWWNSFDNIELTPIIDSIRNLHEDFFLTQKSFDKKF